MKPSPKKRLYSLPEFKANLKLLTKKYRNLKADLQPTLNLLEDGDLPGDKIPDVAYDVYKVRISNSSAQRGKSGGFRLIYYVSLGNTIYLVTVYSKTQQSDIAISKLELLLIDIDTYEE